MKMNAHHINKERSIRRNLSGRTWSFQTAYWL